MATRRASSESEALAWIARQLRWERTLADLRAGRAEVDRKAA